MNILMIILLVAVAVAVALVDSTTVPGTTHSLLAGRLLALATSCY